MSMEIEGSGTEARHERNRNGEIFEIAPNGFDATLELAWLGIDGECVLHQKYQGAFRFVWVRVPTFET